MPGSAVHLRLYSMYKQWELHAVSDDLWYNNTHILIVSTRESAGYRMYM